LNKIHSAHYPTNPRRAAPPASGRGETPFCHPKNPVFRSPAGAHPRRNQSLLWGRLLPSSLPRMGEKALAVPVGERSPSRSRESAVLAMVSEGPCSSF
jgi:hypothetical protein